jgi:hypothetical protein
MWSVASVSRARAPSYLVCRYLSTGKRIANTLASQLARGRLRALREIAPELAGLRSQRGRSGDAGPWPIKRVSVVCVQKASIRLVMTILQVTLALSRILARSKHESERRSWFTCASSAQALARLCLHWG